MKKKQPIQATLPRVAPAKKPARKAKPAKKPAARQTEFQAHGGIVWEKRAQAAPASPPMIRLRLPSEKPTREDAGIYGHVIVFHKNGTSSAMHSLDQDFDHTVIAWLPGRLPEGILPREPSQEEKWRAEFEGLMHRSFAMGLNSDGDYAYPATKAAWRGFLAAKEGGAE